ncbi:MAG TPA: anti-sigma factor domain-containing protein [Chitinophagaceae bacterium]
MSDLRNKLINYEVTPPAPLWDRITTALDESLLTDKFPSRLYNSTEVPPPTAWTTISAALDELNLRHTYPETLYNLETVPPVGAWEKIKSTLDEESAPAITPVKRRVIPFARYAAAAALLAIVAFGAVRIMSRNASEQDGIATGKQSATSIPTPGKSNDVNTNTDVTASAPSNITDEEARNDAALENSKRTYASLDTRDKQKMKKVSEEFFQTPADPVLVSANFNPVHTYEELECTDVNAPVFANNNSAIEIAGRYTMLMTPDGHFIRVSKKLGSLVCCVSGEEQDDDCIDQLKKWRKKIANSPVAPSPGNFMDILDLLNTLKDSSL